MKNDMKMRESRIWKKLILVFAVAVLSLMCGTTAFAG